MPLPVFLRKPTTAFLHDALMVPVAWFCAYLLRFNLEGIPEPFLAQALNTLPIVWGAQLAASWYFGLYRGVWRFASLPDLQRILKAVLVGTALSAALVFLLTRLQMVPRSVFPLYAVLLVALLGGPRLAYRWAKDRSLYMARGMRALVVGAGHAGEALVRDLMSDRGNRYVPVAFLDDDNAKQGREIHGVPVLGPCERLTEVIADREIDLILIALPSANSHQMRRVVEMCEQAGVPFRIVPRIQDVLAGRVGLTELREVSIEDLLGRAPVVLDRSRIQTVVKGRVVLVSGGGGSIGAELCRQLAQLQVGELVILERNEFNLFEIERELRRAYPNVKLAACLGDVCDPVRVEFIMQRYRPEVVFHAAAYKHVPLLEKQVRQAVYNNILGTRTLADAAHRHGVGSFLLISTDKVVNPTNIMGACKRVAEIFCQNFNAHSDTRFLTVRFGNVLDSAGSVVPLFRQQIAAGGPVTVTHPEVMRYFMTIPEACQLILQAGAMGRGGEIYVLDMGRPVKIKYLAEQMIRLSGKEPGRDIEIVYSGLRPGEKLFEELFHEQEQLEGTEHDKILLARYREVDWPPFLAIMDGLAEAAGRHDEAQLLELIRAVVPELHREPDILPDNVVTLKTKT